MRANQFPPWLVADTRDIWLPPEHLYSDPPSRGPRGAMIPNDLDVDKLQSIMYKFFDLCEENELFSSCSKVEKKIQDVFSWSLVSPKIWANYFERIKREIKDQYIFSEFFAICLAVESGEFLSTADPDAYQEPEKWIRLDDGSIAARAPRIEPVLLSPRNQPKPASFQHCVGSLFHYLGLDEPRLLMQRLYESGRPPMCTFSDIFPSMTSKIPYRMKTASDKSFPTASNRSNPGPRLSSVSHASNRSRRNESREGRSVSPVSSSSGWTLGFQVKPKPRTAYDSEEGTLASWDIQYRCQRSLQGRGQLEEELRKIYSYYFPFVVHTQNSETIAGLSPAERKREMKSGCNLKDYWEFWKRIGFFQGIYRDSPPFYINKSFAVGAGMQTLFEEFSQENSKGLQLKMKVDAVLLSFSGWCEALREMGRLIFKDTEASPVSASDRFLHQVILPHCARQEPNPVLTHFKRSEVSSLLQRYRSPLVKLFDIFCGSSPNVHARLTPHSGSLDPSAAAQPAAEDGQEQGTSPGKDRLKLNKGMNVEEFLLLCRCMRICPLLLDELSLRYVFAHAKCGRDRDADAEHLDYDEFVESLCRAALVAYGQHLLRGTEPGQPGQPLLYSRDTQPGQHTAGPSRSAAPCIPRLSPRPHALDRSSAAQPAPDRFARRILASGLGPVARVRVSPVLRVTLPESHAMLAPGTESARARAPL